MDNKINVDEKEIKLIQRTFADNDGLLKALRALFLGLGITDEEKGEIKSVFADDALRAIMWKRFYPTLSKNSPIGQVQDIWLGAEQMVFGQPEGVIKQAVEYKESSLRMTKQALELLENPDGKAIDLSYSPGLVLNDPLQIKLLARNQFIRHIEQQLLFLLIIANQKDETPEKIQEKLNKNSSQ